MQGYVAFLDVLGFSALVRSDEDGAKLNQFGDYLNEATEPVEVDFVVFSDSIVLTAKSDTQDAFGAVLESCSRLFARLLQLNIAVRGAISFGSYERRLIGNKPRQESVFVAGNAVIDAYQFEQAQDWVGIMIAPSARERLHDLPNRCGITHEESRPWAPYVHRCLIPFHRSSQEARDFDGYAVVPNLRRGTAREIATGLREAVDKLGWLRSIAPSPEAQEKFLRTQKWIDRIENEWSNVAAQEERLVNAKQLSQPRAR